MSTFLKLKIYIIFDVFFISKSIAFSSIFKLTCLKKSWCFEIVGNLFLQIIVQYQHTQHTHVY